MSDYTRAEGLFPSKDITFHGRKQSAILTEGVHPSAPNDPIQPPVSLTPESLVRFVRAKSESSVDQMEKRAFDAIADMIQEVPDLRRKVAASDLRGRVSDDG